MLLDTTGCLRILLIARSAALRLRLRHTLGAVPEVALLDQTGDTAEGVRLIRRLRPHLILLDTLVAADPALLGLFAGADYQPVPRLILLDSDSGGHNRVYPVPLAAHLPSDLPADELVAYLSTLVDMRVTSNAARTPLLEHAMPPRGTPDQGTRDRRATDRGWSPTTAAPAPATPPKRPASPPPAAAASGPLDQDALERAAQVLVRSMFPVSIVVVELCDVPDAARRPEVEAIGRLTQRLEATIRQSVRRDDLVCTLESLTCAALLPGLLHEQQSLITNRMADAIRDAPFDGHGGDPELLPAIGIASWEPIQPEIDLLREARSASSATRAALLRRYQPSTAW